MAQDLTKPTNSVNLVTVELTKAQVKFLEFCKEFGWGKLEVQVKDGEPVMSRELEHDHKHD